MKEYDAVVLNPENLEGKIGFLEIFGRTGPVHIEVGAGKGSFLVSEAQACPEVDFIGIEWARKYYRYTADRIGRWQLKNVRMIRTDAASFITDHIPDDSVQCFHVYFPDPWPKKRHHKRRFLCSENLEQLIRCLKSGGQIRIATDHADYFEQIKSVLAQRADCLEEIEFKPAAGAEPGELTGTNYERKYIKDRRLINVTAVRKK